MTLPTEKTGALYELLSGLAAERSGPYTYGTISAILTWHLGTPIPRWRMAAMLAAVSRHCAANSEPDLTSMVVLAATGEPSVGYPGGEPAAERAACRALHTERRYRTALA